MTDQAMSPLRRRMIEDMTISRTRPSCCARATDGHAAADPAIPVMKSRRRIAFLSSGLRPIMAFA